MKEKPTQVLLSMKIVQCAALNCNINTGQGLIMYLFPKDPLGIFGCSRWKEMAFNPPVLTLGYVNGILKKTSFAININNYIDIELKKNFIRCN